MKRLYVVLGATAIGKTRIAIEIAKRLGTEIVSCDSRQIYKGIPIGTAAPTEEEMREVKHHFVQEIELEEYYSCGRFETDAIATLEKIYETRDTAVMCGGSMLYIDAVCNGIDDLPDVDRELREGLWRRYEEEGIDNMYGELKILDPEYAKKVDRRNYKRIIHALELCIESGGRYTDLRTQRKKERDFEIVKIGLRLEREEIYERINRRVDAMMEAGLEEEARRVFPKRELNSLNTVGYKEMFRYISGEWTKERAVEEIKKNTRRYAKKQMTWWQRDGEIEWFSPKEVERIMERVMG